MNQNGWSQNGDGGFIVIIGTETTPTPNLTHGSPLLPKATPAPHGSPQRACGGTAAAISSNAKAYARDLAPTRPNPSALWPSQAKAPPVEQGKRGCLPPSRKAWTALPAGDPDVRGTSSSASSPPFQIHFP